MTDPVNDAGVGVGTESTLSNWIGPYVTDMLGRAEALSSMPYTPYMGPLTAGPSSLQTNAWGGIAGLTLPNADQTSFTPTTFASTYGGVPSYSANNYYAPFGSSGAMYAPGTDLGSAPPDAVSFPTAGGVPQHGGGFMTPGSSNVPQHGGGFAASGLSSVPEHGGGFMTPDSGGAPQHGGGFMTPDSGGTPQHGGGFMAPGLSNVPEHGGGFMAPGLSNVPQHGGGFMTPDSGGAPQHGGGFQAPGLSSVPEHGGGFQAPDLSSVPQHGGGFQASPSMFSSGDMYASGTDLGSAPPDAIGLPGYGVLPEGSSTPTRTNISAAGTLTPMELRTYGDIAPFDVESFDFANSGSDPYNYDRYGDTGAYTQDTWTDPANYTRYMSPFIEQALAPQLEEAARQAEIQRTKDASRLTKAGAYGGSRQAIMESELNDNLARLQNEITGTGLQRAYESGQGQFNTEEQARRDQFNIDRDVGLGQNRWENQFLSGRADTDLDRRLSQFNREQDARRQQTNLEAGRDLGQWNLEDAVRLAQRNLEEDRYRDQFNLEEESRRDQYNTETQRMLNQFNTEQGMALQGTQANRMYGLDALSRMLQAGAEQRGIEGQGIAADYARFQEERDYPYRQLQYMQSMLQGLPLGTASYSYSQPSQFNQWSAAAGGIGELLGRLFGDQNNDAG